MTRITSYGIILFDRLGSDLRVLLCNRRDTYRYIMLLNGIWSNEHHIRELIQSMTQEERDRIVKYSFDELWDDLYVDHSLRVYVNRRPRNKYLDKEKFIKSEAASLSPQECHTPMKMWEFSKGKKENNETNMECARREFEEETRLDSRLLRFVNAAPVGIQFTGTDRRQYEVFYYVAELMAPVAIPDPLTLPSDRIRTSAHSGEVAEVQWVSVRDAACVISRMNQDVLRDALQLYRQAGASSYPMSA